MRRPLLLTSADNPRVKQIVRLRKQRDRREDRVFVAEGSREVTRALEAGLKIRELYWSPDLTGLNLASLAVRLPGLEAASPSLFEVTPALFAKIAYNENPEGILAVFDQPDWRLEDLARSPASSAAADLYLVASGTNKPGNLGAMARTAAAAGANALLAADADVDVFNPNAIRASTGAVFTLPTLSAPSATVMDFLKSRKVSVLAATPDARQAYTDVDLTRPLAIVIGAEDTGVNRFWLDAADLRVTIPMNTEAVDSLNASNAAAILLFETLRQRRAKSS